MSLFKHKSISNIIFDGSISTFHRFQSLRFHPRWSRTLNTATTRIVLTFKVVFHNLSNLLLFVRFALVRFALSRPFESLAKHITRMIHKPHELVTQPFGFQNSQELRTNRIAETSRLQIVSQIVPFGRARFVDRRIVAIRHATPHVLRLITIAQLFQRQSF